MSYPPQGGGAPPKSNMVISVVSLVIGLSLCVVFAVPGIMAVIQAGKVNGLAQSGNMAAAHEASAKARRLAIIGLIISAVVVVLGIILFVVALALGDDNSTSGALAAL